MSSIINKKVSIVIPTFNRARYLRRAIESCLNQTYGNLEILIVDDGSEDETSEVVRNFAARDERIKYYRFEKNVGLPVALNRGWELVTGDYLTMSGDDNYFHINAIEKMVRFLESQRADFVYCDYYRFEESEQCRLRRMKLPDRPNLRICNSIGPCFLFSRRAYSVIGELDSSTFLAEDYDYWIRFSSRYTLHHLSEPLYFYREHKGSLSMNRRREIRIISTLVKLKNGLINCKQAIAEFATTYIIEKYQHLPIIIFIKIIPESISEKLLFMLGKIYYTMKSENRMLIDAKNAFEAYHMHHIDIQSAKNRLEMIIKNILGNNS